MMNVFDIIAENFNCCRSKKEKEEFIDNLIKFANELYKEELENED